MSDEKDVSEMIVTPGVVTTAQEVSTVPTQEVPERTPLIGYTVALLSDGNFHFEVLGTDKGLVQLLGVHQYATGEVKKVHDNAVLSGDRLVNEVGRMLNLLNERLERVENTLKNTLKGANTL